MSKEELRKAKLSREAVDKSRPRPGDLVYRVYRKPQPERPPSLKRVRKTVQKPVETVFDVLKRQIRGGK
jgi:uncharacterized protein (DUF2267 family)